MKSFSYSKFGKRDKFDFSFLDTSGDSWNGEYKKFNMAAYNSYIDPLRLVSFSAILLMLYLIRKIPMS